jgi:hypothetical protein
LAAAAADGSSTFTFGSTRNIRAITTAAMCGVEVCNGRRTYEEGNQRLMLRQDVAQFAEKIDLVRQLG